jgi:hypothetical protein
MSTTLRGGREVPGLTESAFAEAIWWSKGILKK